MLLKENKWFTLFSWQFLSVVRNRAAMLFVGKHLSTVNSITTSSSGKSVSVAIQFGENAVLLYVGFSYTNTLKFRQYSVKQSAGVEPYLPSNG